MNSFENIPSNPLRESMEKQEDEKYTIGEEREGNET